MPASSSSFSPEALTAVRAKVRAEVNIELTEEEIKDMMRGSWSLAVFGHGQAPTSYAFCKTPQDLAATLQGVPPELVRVVKPSTLEVWAEEKKPVQDDVKSIAELLKHAQRALSEADTHVFDTAAILGRVHSSSHVPQVIKTRLSSTQRDIAAHKRKLMLAYICPDDAEVKEATQLARDSQVLCDLARRDCEHVQQMF